MFSSGCTYQRTRPSWTPGDGVVCTNINSSSLLACLQIVFRTMATPCINCDGHQPGACVTASKLGRQVVLGTGDIVHANMVTNTPLPPPPLRTRAGWRGAARRNPSSTVHSPCAASVCNAYRYSAAS